VIRVRVLYFAAVRDLVGREEEEIVLPDGVDTVSAFVAWIQAERGELLGRMGSVRIARNEAFASGTEKLAAGDVLALIPPVAGG
jgi:molybdopterin synthase sulfur carrier subunit